MTRKTVKLKSGTKDRLGELKRDGETWDGLLLRMAEATEELERKGGQSGVPVCSKCGSLATTWTLIDGAVHCEDCADVDFPD